MHGYISVLIKRFRKSHNSLSKLKDCDIRGQMLTLMEMYLNNKMQRICIDSSYNYSNITMVIPQGAILGQILFSIYINDISFTYT